LRRREHQPGLAHDVEVGENPRGMHVVIGAAKLFGEQNGSAGASDIGAEAGNDGHSREREYRRSALGRRRARRVCAPMSFSSSAAI